jgi:hypothetical protein
MYGCVDGFCSRMAAESRQLLGAVLQLAPRDRTVPRPPCSRTAAPPPELIFGFRLRAWIRPQKAGNGLATAGDAVIAEERKSWNA